MQLCQSEWTVLQSLWERQPQTLMQLVEDLKVRAGWSASTSKTIDACMSDVYLGCCVMTYTATLSPGCIRFGFVRYWGFLSSNCARLKPWRAAMPPSVSPLTTV